MLSVKPLKTIVEAIIEMPADTSYKYELNEHGNLVLDRTLDLMVPFNYGFVPNTMCDDGDPLDIFVVSSASIYPKAHVKAELLGVFKCIDNGEKDDKLVAVLVGEEGKIDDEARNAIKNLIEYYLKNYKKGFEVFDFDDAIEAGINYKSSRVMETF